MVDTKNNRIIELKNHGIDKCHLHVKKKDTNVKMYKDKYFLEINAYKHILSPEGRTSYLHFTDEEIRVQST